MSFFERYFAALDGPDPYSSLDLVAGDVEFVIEWGTEHKGHQVTGGLSELRAFIDQGERGAWAHHVLHSASGHGAAGDRVEFVMGETRRPTGERVATFMAVAELDSRGRMRRYLAARTPVISFTDTYQEQGWTSH
jgi:hypothetical protein